MSSEFDLSHPPFDLLSPEEQHKLVSRLDIGYFGNGETIIDGGQEAESVYVVLKGAVAELNDQAHETDPYGGVIREYAHEDLFGAISIINGTSRYTFRTLEETISWQLPKEVFLELMEANEAFAAYFQNTLAEKARLLEQRRSEKLGGGDMSTFMLAKVKDSVLRDAVILKSGTTILEATRTMREQHADCLLVQKGSQYGMVTRTDLLEGVVLQDMGLESDICDLASYGLLTVESDDFLFNALVLMTRHKIQRVVAFDHGQLAGLVELTDVLSFFSSQSHVIGLQIERASNLEELAIAAKGTTELINGLVAQGVKVRFAMDLLAALNGRIIAKAYEQLVPEEVRKKTCLLVMGSEGRGEQVLKTDQDNALIIADDLDWNEYGKVMDKFTSTLLDFGYPLCPGKIMVSNPEWVMRESEWRKTLRSWTASVEGNGLMNLAIFVDAHPVAGDSRLFKNLRDDLFHTLEGNEVFYSYFAMPLRRFSTPLTFFGGLKKSDAIDIKKGGIFPIVHGVRTMALQFKVKETNTFQRIEALVEKRAMKRKFADDLSEALAVLSTLRLQQQLRVETGQAAPGDGNMISAVGLNKLDRDLLREALHMVKEFKSRMSHRYHLDR
jgi:CBS domain-containing protein